MVHGTFAKNSTWYQKGGGFFTEVENWSKSLGHEIQIRSFSWSGGLSPGRRLQGACELAKTLVLECAGLDDDVKKIVVGHSHGANVAFLASQIVAMASRGQDLNDEVTKLVEKCWSKDKDWEQCFKNCGVTRSIGDCERLDHELDLQEIGTPSKSELIEEMVGSIQAFMVRGDDNCVKINEIYALGTPIDAKTYFPEKTVVDRVYSIYSQEDQLQVYSSRFKRRFVEFGALGFEKGFITEIKATFAQDSSAQKVEHPRHLILNTSFFGRWILEIPEIIGECDDPSRYPNNCRQAWIHFFKDLSRPELKKQRV